MEKWVIAPVLCVMTLFGCRPAEGPVLSIVRHPEKHAPTIDENGHQFIEAGSYYGDVNFILLNRDTILYHNRSQPRICGTGLIPWKPACLNLAKEDVHIVPQDRVVNYVDSAIRQSFPQWTRRDWGRGSIASPVDSIRDPSFTLIRDAFKRLGVHTYAVRNLTEEERYVVDAIRSGKDYRFGDRPFEVGFDSPPVLEAPPDSPSPD